MKTIILEQPGQLKLVETEGPQSPKEDEVLVRVERVGICGTDLHAFSGNQNFFTYPRILGHELAVRIEAIGVTTVAHNFAIGDLCCVIPYLSCGTCIACRNGKENCCTSLQVLGVHTDGGMRERFCLPLDRLVKADGISTDELALVEMLAVGAHAVRRAGVSKGDVALIIGAGPIGLATAQFVHLSGGKAILVDVSQERLHFCREILRMQYVIDANTDPIPQIKAITQGDLPIVVFDATGNAKSMNSAFDYVAHGGKLVLVGHIKGDITFSDPLFHSREMTLLASRAATLADFNWVIDSIRQKKIDLGPWITHRTTPELIVEEFPHWLTPSAGVIKAVLAFD